MNPPRKRHLCSLLMEWGKENGRDGVRGKMKQEIGKTPFPPAGERYLQKCVSDNLTLFSLNCSFGKL